MSDTPETDAFIEGLNDDWDVEFAALTAHAKQLERKCNLYNSYFESSKAELKQFKRALSDARIEAHNWKKAFAALNPPELAHPSSALRPSQ